MTFVQPFFRYKEQFFIGPEQHTIFMALFLNEVSKNGWWFTSNRIHTVEKVCSNAKLCLHNVVVVDQCRELEFPATFFFFGERLIDHEIRTIEVIDKDFCELSCYIEHNCVSINFKVEASLFGKHDCDLNKATHKGNENDLVKAAGYIYHGTNVRKPYIIYVLRYLYLYYYNQRTLRVILSSLTNPLYFKWCHGNNMNLFQKNKENNTMQEGVATRQIVQTKRKNLDPINIPFHFKNACDKVPCKNNGICQSGFTSKGYRCLCTSDFTGHDCEHGENLTLATTFITSTYL